MNFTNKPEPLASGAGWAEMVQQKLASYPAWITDSGVYGLSGLALGFIVKKMGRLFFWAIAFVMVVLVIAHYTKGNVINVEPFKEIFTSSTIASFEEFFQYIIALAHAHSAATISLVVGFCVGWYLG